MKATARVRVIPSLPWTEDFETVELEKIPRTGSVRPAIFVREKDGNKVLVKTPVQRGLNRSNVYLGPSTMKNYQIQIDLMGTKNKRRLPDLGLIANRYTLDMQADTNACKSVRGHPIYAWRKQSTSRGKSMSGIR